MLVDNETEAKKIDLSNVESENVKDTIDAHRRGIKGHKFKRTFPRKNVQANPRSDKRPIYRKSNIVDSEAWKRHDTGAALINPKNVKTAFHQERLEKKKQNFLERIKETSRAEILDCETEGYLLPEAEGKRIITQSEICSSVDIASASKHFDLDLKRFGPYRVDYTNNGRHLLIGGKRGHVAAFDWMTKKLHCEMNVLEAVRDVKWLHVETMYAVAQKRWTHIYDNVGVELHCIKELHDIRRLEFLPRHFLLVAGANTSFLHYLDVSMGKMVQSFATRQGPLNVMTQNPSNAIIHTGHGNGTVQLWSPNVREPLVKMLAHASSIQGIAVTGDFMATTGLDRKLRIWDVRNFKQLHSYSLPFGLTEVDFSQRNMVACSVGNSLQVFSDAHLGTTTSPYLVHHLPGLVSALRFCPYEDVLAVGHQDGFTSLLVPGSGQPNFNALLVNPYETKNQRREREVKQLLEKIQPELISLDVTEISQVNTKLMEDENERLKKVLHMRPREVKFKPKNKKKGRGSGLRKERRKQGVEYEKRFATNEMKKQAEKMFHLKKEAESIEEKTVLDRKEKTNFKLPQNLDDAKKLGLVLLKYKEKNYYTVFFGVAIVYIVLQSLAIPGSIFLTVLSGYLFSFPMALFLVCTCSAFGALICYFVSLSMGRERILGLAPEIIEKWQNEISSFDNIFFCIVFLRITPILPNWLINVSSPIFNVPVGSFFFGTFFGVAPPSCIYIQAGATLQKLTNVSAAWSWSAVSLVAVAALISLIPVVYQWYRRSNQLKQKIA